VRFEAVDEVGDTPLRVVHYVVCVV
jgi:hypothetical protein